MADEPAGWYLDASQTGIERYWDGSTWTDQTRQAMAPAPISGKTPTVIVWAFVLALIGFCGITALVGLVLGLLGRGRAKAAGAGVGLSTAAILISIGWLVLLVFGASRDLDAVSSQGPIAPTIASTGSVGATNAAPAPVGTCSPEDCQVGERGPGGGIVFYDVGSDQPWGRYLEVAPPSWYEGGADPRSQWCDATDLDVAGTSTEIGAGAANTQLAIAACAAGAANTAHQFAGGGMTDWFLPSKDELNLLYAQQRSIGGFASDDYWSSSQADPSGAWHQYFTDGDQYGFSKYDDYNVRPVRAF